MVTGYPVRIATFAPVAATPGPLAVLADDDTDFGSLVERQIKPKSGMLFGVEMPLADSALATSGACRSPSQSASDQVLDAHGLKVRYPTREAANNADMTFRGRTANTRHTSAWRSRSTASLRATPTSTRSTTWRSSRAAAACT